MIGARMLSYITGTVDQELLLRNEYLAAENRILRAQISGRLLVSICFINFLVVKSLFTLVALSKSFNLIVGQLAFPVLR